VYLSFNLAVAPWKPERSIDGVAIPFESARERCPWRVCRNLKPLWPRYGITVADHLKEASGCGAERFQFRGHRIECLQKTMSLDCFEHQPSDMLEAEGRSSL